MLIKNLSLYQKSFALDHIQEIDIRFKEKIVEKKSLQNMEMKRKYLITSIDFIISWYERLIETRKN